jgi:hypothetical protein
LIASGIPLLLIRTVPQQYIPSANRLSNKAGFVHKFFPVSLVEKIVAETNAYAVKCIQVRPDKVWVPTTFAEMMAFLGIHVVFSTVGIPSYTLAWKSTWPFEIPLKLDLKKSCPYKSHGFSQQDAWKGL